MIVLDNEEYCGIKGCGRRRFDKTKFCVLHLPDEKTKETESFPPFFTNSYTSIEEFHSDGSKCCEKTRKSNSGCHYCEICGKRCCGLKGYEYS